MNDLLDLIRSNEIELKLIQDTLKTEIELVESKEEQEKKALELDHLKSKIAYTKQRVLESSAKTRFLNLQSDFLENSGKPISNSGKRILSQQLKEADKSKNIQCPKCAQNFTFHDPETLTRAKENLTDHYAEAHKAFFTNDEINDLRKITI